MPFRHAYRVVEPYIVGVVQTFHPRNQHIPNTWGSGFVVSEHGVVATCACGVGVPAYFSAYGR